jgi:hemoglobin
VTDYERIGGTEGLRRLVQDFVDRERNDPIIGFLFADVDLDRLIAHEVDFAAQHLGGPHRYAGRPLGEAHRPRRIHRGWFRRRLALLRKTMSDHGVDDELIERWLARERRLESLVTDGTDCVPDGG